MEDGNRAASGSMSNGEIEDVLDSIRRLVSQSSSAGAVGAPRGRLILTPAFRVDGLPGTDAYPEPAPCAGTAKAAPAVRAAPADARRWSASPALAGLDPEYIAGGIDADPDSDPGATRAWPGEDESPADIAARRAEIASRAAAEAATLDALRRVVTRDHAGLSLETSPPGLNTPGRNATPTEAGSGRSADDGDAEDCRTKAPGSDDEDPTEALERTIAELEAAIAASAEDWDPDGSERCDLTDMPHPGGPVPEAINAGLEDRAGRSAGGAPAELGLEQDPPGDPAPKVDAAGASAPVAGVEPPVSMGPAPAMAVDPDLDSQEERCDRIGDRAPFAQVAEEWSDDLDSTETEAVLDEEMLRDLVARIVREELQGRLGERITRNVRKLVRAEIARALSERPYG